MKEFYYSIANNQTRDWESEKQYKVVFTTFLEFANFCQQLSNSQHWTIRGCTSPGYRNQGSYYSPQN